MRIRFFFISIIIFFSLHAFSRDADKIVFTESESTAYIGKQLYILKDPSHQFQIEDVIRSDKFKASNTAVPNLGISDAAYWIRFDIINKSSSKHLLLNVQYPTLDSISLYKLQNGKVTFLGQLGEYENFSRRVFKQQDYIFPLSLAPDSSAQYFFKVSAQEQMQLPVNIGLEKGILEDISLKNLLFGLYAGIIIVMVLYNLFVFFSVRDLSYIFYVLYILFVGLTQATLDGYGFKYLWPNSPWFEMNSTLIIPVFSGLTALIFVDHFLKVKHYAPRYHKGIMILIGLYIGCILLQFISKPQYAQLLVQFTVVSAALLVIATAVKIASLGYRPAIFFLSAWTIFILSVCVFVLRNFSVLPYNIYTYYAMEIGSTIEVTLLSFALADRINIYKKEKEESQAEALRLSKESERLTREQNILLESRVKERTQALEASNSNLQVAMANLKETQSQLVEAEKMVSLGQLTAGIAHEINNPINFVKSNIKPLKLDFTDIKELISKYNNIHPANGASIEEQLQQIEDFKKEIDLDYLNDEIETLLNGIEDGATRTAEIVKGLRTFSRLDESELKEADIHEGIDATLLLLKTTIPSYLNIIKNYGELPMIECYPGKLNQVFMNILNNAIQAIKSKPDATEERITITTSIDDEKVHISIRDTGPGIPAEVKEKIFDPFYTTKDVGEGTGLGLSIVFSIIEKHKGKIKVNSVVGEGTEFIITLPTVGTY